jgi:hypothetical protein
MKTFSAFLVFLLLTTITFYSLKNIKVFKNIPITINNKDYRYNTVQLYYWLSDTSDESNIIKQWNGNKPYFGSISITPVPGCTERYFLPVELVKTTKALKEYKIVIMSPDSKEYISSIIML